MSDKEALPDSRSSQAKIQPSETEVAQLFKEAAQQYEEYMRLAGLADTAAQRELSQPRYAWDNPIGLVVTLEPARSLNRPHAGRREGSRRRQIAQVCRRGWNLSLIWRVCLCCQ